MTIYKVYNIMKSQCAIEMEMVVIRCASYDVLTGKEFDATVYYASTLITLMQVQGSH